MPAGGELAVVGGGWAGLAAAVEATRRGHRVTLFEMAGQLGGRARSVEVAGVALDNGQHICIGAYAETLRLLGTIGVAESDVFLRTPLRLDHADGRGLRLGQGPALLAFTRAVLVHPRWGGADKLRLLRAAARWLLAGFRCAPGLSVAQLTAKLPQAVRTDLIEPLCIAALNTPVEAASAGVFLRVLGDALFSGRGSADLLLPRVALGDVLPAPAARWLHDAGATIRLGDRVDTLTREYDRWLVDGLAFDGVVLAASAVEAARLTRGVAPGWAGAAAAFEYEPIVTVYLRCRGAVLPEPMLALRAEASSPAQFVFDRGQLGGEPGLLAFVISGARSWVEAGTEATVAATRRQAEAAFGARFGSAFETVQVITEKRATFRCTPGLQRPAARIAARLRAAGDYVDGPYPSTLEGAVRSGIAAGGEWER